MDWFGSSLISHIAWLHRARPSPEKLCQGLNDITIIISGLMSCNIGCGTVIAGFTGNGDRKVSYHCIHSLETGSGPKSRFRAEHSVGNEQVQQLKLSTSCSGPFLKNYDGKLQRLLTERRGNGN